MKRTGGGVTPSVVVLDNGAGYCKAGMAGQAQPTAVVPNCLARPRSAKKWLVADQVQECDDIQSIAIKRPIDRGYMISPDVEREIWDRIFKTHLKVNTTECGLMLVEPLFTLSSIQKTTDELVFEDFGFQSFCVGNSAVSTHAYQAHKAPTSILARGRTSLVVDSGFSFTHAAPVFQNKVVTTSAKRINLGGKALTNYLKELVSYRAWNVMDETYIIEDVKEKLCFVSTDIDRDLNIARMKGRGNTLRREYVLPDGVKYKRGFVKEPEPEPEPKKVVNVSDEDDDDEEDGDFDENNADEDQVDEEKKQREQRSRAPPRKPLTKPSAKQEEQQELTLTNERFLVPEMLFHPADLGMNEAGLAECIVRAINACEPELHALLYQSVLLTGGNTLLPGFKDRLEHELRPLVTDDYNINIEVVD
ncbi:hypothetical protein M758_3G182100 [Ceratodon purpureus]|nr:hypothetical protein M758_3G182100 [Ceratodon purpureus]